jgi:UPF0755 protein
MSDWTPNRQPPLSPKPMPQAGKQPAHGPKWGAIAVVVVVGVVLVAIAVTAFVLLRPESNVPAGKPVTVHIAKGIGSSGVARTLVGAGVIRNSAMFLLMAKAAGASDGLKPGTYELSTGMPNNLVIQQLLRGPQPVYYDVTIPEGFTIRQMASRLAKQAHIPEDEFLTLATTGAPKFAADHPYLENAFNGSLEGFLFPKTYRIKKGTSAEQVISMMLNQFDTETAKLDLSYATSKNLTLSDVVIIASILERETKLPQEYPLVASVIYNRLRVKMRLGLDSTVFYGLPEGQTTISKADLANVTPYNTYRKSGLPAGPISNPGLDALKAAASPASTPYLYYVLTSKDGSQTFTTNYKDFLKAVQKYHQVFGK